jgi:hypothetical protein
MDYPKLNETLEHKKTEIEKEIDSVRAKLDEALETLGEYEGGLGERRSELRDFRNSKRAKSKPAAEAAKIKRLGNATGRIKAKKSLIGELEARMQKLVSEMALAEESILGLKDFDPISEQANDPELLADFEFSKKAYRKPNSVFKVFEGRFTPLKYRVMPRVDGRFAAEPWNRIPIDHCVVDPSLIPDWLMEEFKLADGSEGLNEVQKLKLKSQAIHRLRELFRHVNPLRHFDGKGQVAPNHRFLAVNGFDSHSDGKLIYSRSFGQEEESVDGKMIQTYESAYDALRMTGHAKRGYQAEMPMLMASEIAIESIQLQLSEVRKTDFDYEEKKEALREKLANEAVRFKNATNYFKKAAYEELFSKIGFRDSKGRENLGATCATLLKAIRILKARAPQVSNKSQYGQMDRQTLELLVDESEALLDSHFAEWGAIADRLEKMGSTAVFNGSPEEKLGNQREYLAKKLFSVIETLRSLDTIQPVRPFLQYVQLLKAQMEKVRAAIQGRNLELAVKESEKGVSLGAIFRAQKGIEEIVRGISLDPTPNLDSLQSQVVSLLDAMGSDYRFPSGSRASTLNGLLLSTLNEFKWDLEEVRKANPKAEELAEALKPLKDKLGGLDFAFCLQSLG